MSKCFLIELSGRVCVISSLDYIANGPFKYIRSVIMRINSNPPNTLGYFTFGKNDEKTKVFHHYF